MEREGLGPISRESPLRNQASRTEPVGVESTADMPIGPSGTMDPGDRSRLLEFGPLILFSFTSGINESSLTALDAPVISLCGDKELGR